jgi:hypothetical protein
MAVEVVVIGGEAYTPQEIMEMSREQFDELTALDECATCALNPCDPITAAKCVGATLYDSMGE